MVKKIQKSFEMEIIEFRASKYNFAFSLLQRSMSKHILLFEDNVITEYTIFGVFLT